jgi:hypothetical protein
VFRRDVKQDKSGLKAGETYKQAEGEVKDNG